MGIPHPLADELNTWSAALGPDLHDAARDEFRKLYGSNGTAQEVLSHLVSTYGTDRIKHVWKQLYASPFVR